MTRFEACLPHVLSSEGGYVDDPRDSGGATNLGVTQAALTAFLGRPASKAEVKALTPATVAPIYEKDYWRPACCDVLPAGVDYMIFDLAVNSGPRRAKMFLQEAVGVAPDGMVGMLTLNAVKRADPKALIQAIRARREAYYRSLDNFDHFGRGWLNRLGEVTSQALAWA